MIILVRELVGLMIPAVDLLVDGRVMVLRCGLGRMVDAMVVLGRLDVVLILRWLPLDVVTVRVPRCVLWVVNV